MSSPWPVWLNRTAALAFAGAAVLALSIWLLWSRESPQVDPSAAVDHSPMVVENAGERNPEVVLPQAPLRPLPPKPVPQAPKTTALTPDNVIENPDCMLLPGRGRANDTAIVILPTSEGAHFTVLDGNGEVFGDTLPFLPHEYHLGRRADGTVLAGFGDLRLNSRHFRDRDTPEPVRVYMDGQVIYESDKTWRFSVAPDGSSFYVHEPLAGGASRLIVHNLDELAERHFDMDRRYTPSNDYESGFGVSYSSGSAEVVFGPVYEYGRGAHVFFPVAAADGDVREVHVARSAREEMVGGGRDQVRIDDVEAAVFASSEVGYVAAPLVKRGPYWKGQKPWTIERLGIDHGDKRTSVVWSREVELENFDSTMTLSDDGAWLALRAWTFKVLDTATGETVFEYPRVDKQAEFARLSSVLPPGATLRDVGGVTSQYFRDNRLVLFRQVGLASKRVCNGKDQEEYDHCIADLRGRGLYKTMVDVFEMDSIEMDSQPDFRVGISSDNRCASGDYALRGLQVHDGRLTFLTTRR